MDINRLRKLYGQLKGLREVVAVQVYIHADTVADFNAIVEEIATITGDPLERFLIKSFSRYGHETSSDSIRPKLLQLISTLEYGYNLTQEVIEIGSLYNAIKDEELRARCSDILSAPGNFDRVVNQATLVLEDRIRTKAAIRESLTGVPLVNKVLNADKKKTLLIISDNDEEHEGVCHICRGIMLAFRNPTHHYLLDSYSREDALKVCGFIDNLLNLINKAKLNK